MAKVKQSADPIADLTRTVTKNYRETSVSPGFLSFISRRRNAFRAKMHIHEMMQDPRIGFGIELLKGPILSKAKFKVETDNTAVKEFLIKQITRFWRNGARISLNAIVYGYSGSEVLYKYNKISRMVD